MQSRCEGRCGTGQAAGGGGRPLCTPQPHEAHARHGRRPRSDKRPTEEALRPPGYQSQKGAGGGSIKGMGDGVTPASRDSPRATQRRSNQEQPKRVTRPELSNSKQQGDSPLRRRDLAASMEEQGTIQLIDHEEII
ncbi:hypothetical protein NDU88_004242 [Pleurodeles waltl]|uniref:Uncharacterized protein n=1 Tax=Pleurodeles waltl TaxID=8319 RepID=A0AAV7QE74_PLEWA|nr:hypothetical protein NDU88_004242 [Pleurodeles waltl]